MEDKSDAVAPQIINADAMVTMIWEQRRIRVVNETRSIVASLIV